MINIAVRYVSSVAAISRPDWEACFPFHIEDYDYHLSIEAAGLDGFEFGWYVAELDGRPACVVPVFVTAYDLGTTAQGLTKSAISAIRPYVPGQLTLKLSCLGSPETESCPMGFHPILHQGQHKTILEKVLGRWALDARLRGVGLLGIKDLSNDLDDQFRSIFERAGFRALASLPTARLRIDFPSIDSYLTRLSAATRKDLRRKLKCRDEVRIEFRQDVGPHLDQLMAMYLETRSRSDWTFEDLPPQYLTEVLTRMPGRAILVLYHHDEKLVASNLLLIDNRALIDKFFFMRGAEGRRLNLYFLSWITNIEFCLERGLEMYQSGQAAYETKIRLGSLLTPNWIYFRHLNPILNRALRFAAPWLEVEPPAQRRQIAEVAS